MTLEKPTSKHRLSVQVDYDTLAFVDGVAQRNKTTRAGAIKLMVRSLSYTNTKPFITRSSLKALDPEDEERYRIRIACRPMRIKGPHI
jgi:hypothetical protein